VPETDDGRPEQWAQVWLIEFDGEWAEHAPARLAEAFGIDVAQAEKITSSLPHLVKRLAPLAVAEQYAAALGSIGARVELREAVGPRPQSPPAMPPDLRAEAVGGTMLATPEPTEPTAAEPMPLPAPAPTPTPTPTPAEEPEWLESVAPARESNWGARPAARSSLPPPVRHRPPPPSADAPPVPARPRRTNYSTTQAWLMYLGIIALGAGSLAWGMMRDNRHGGASHERASGEQMRQSELGGTVEARNCLESRGACLVRTERGSHARLLQLTDDLYDAGAEKVMFAHAEWDGERMVSSSLAVELPDSSPEREDVFVVFDAFAEPYTGSESEDTGQKFLDFELY